MKNDKKTAEDWIESVKKQKEDRSKRACVAVIGVTLVFLALFWIVGNNVINLPYGIITGTLFIAYIYIMGHKEIHTEKRMIATMIFMSVVLNMTIYHVQIETGLQGAVGAVDSLYKSLILIMGEYNEITTENTVLIYAHNFGRFFALVTLYGSIFVIFLRKQIRYQYIKKFYKDIIIITDKPEGFVLDLAYKLCLEGEKKQGHKVVLGYVDKECMQNIEFDDGVPKVYVDIRNTENISKGLGLCNIDEAKQVFLLCDDVETNVKIAKVIYNIKVADDACNTEVVHPKTQPGSASGDDNVDGQDGEKDSQEIIYEKTKFYDVIERKPREDEPLLQMLLPKFDSVIFTLLNGHQPKIKSGEVEQQKLNTNTENETEKIKCFIQYKDDESRYYYSFDEAFLNQEDAFDSYFINPYDIGLRQMIVKSRIHDKLKFFYDNDNDNDSEGEGKNGDKEIITYNVCVSGSDNLAYRTFVEIARNNVYSTKPLTIYYVDDREEDDLKSLKTRIEAFNKQFGNGMVQVKHITFKALKDDSKNSVEKLIQRIHQFYLCDINEPKIRTYIQKVFQMGVGLKVDEYIVVTKGSDTEYGILENYLRDLFSHEVKLNDGQDKNRPILYLSRVSDLLVSYSDFYDNHGKGAKELREAYLKALEKNNQSKDFSKLPEIFKDSDILSLIHKRRMTDVIKKRYYDYYQSKFESDPEKDYLDLCRDIISLSSTEHSRWYNERTLQGFVDSDTIDNKFTNVKTNLKVYESLDIEQKYMHHKYFLQDLQEKILHNTLYDDTSNLIIRLEYQFKTEEE